MHADRRLTTAREMLVFLAPAHDGPRHTAMEKHVQKEEPVGITLFCSCGVRFDFSEEDIVVAHRSSFAEVVAAFRLVPEAE